MDRTREPEITLERRRALVRALNVSELREAGDARTAALEAADAELERIGALLPGALQAGLSLAEISRLTGVSRPTLYELKARKAEVTQDLRLEILQALAVSGAQNADELTTNLGRKKSQVRPMLKALEERGWIAADVGSESRFSLTRDGEGALETWDFGGPLSERATGVHLLALKLFGFSPEEMGEVEDKFALAEARGHGRLGLATSLRMGVRRTLEELAKTDAKEGGDDGNP